MMLTKNIVLIGLSGSGKTAFSKRLAARYGLTLIDMDSEIVKKTGRSIAEIFASDGEKAFRDMETECAEECAGLSGAVISTGGGVVLREENMKALGKNAWVIFLDRKPEEIIGEDLSDRPLVAGNQEKIFHLQERLPLYEKYADAVVHNRKEKDDTERAIVETVERLIREDRENTENRK